MSDSDNLDLPSSDELDEAAAAEDEKRKKRRSSTSDDSDSESKKENTLKKISHSGILSEIRETEKELKYRSKNFKDPDDVIINRKLRCTSCNSFLQSLLLEGRDIYQHPVLKVLLCKNCLEFYGDGNLSLDEDGSGKYCRWCAQGGTLYCCADCCNAFCKKCIKRNLNRSILVDIESDDWKCFMCNGEPLWELRAICKNAHIVSKKIKRKRKEENERNLKKLQKKRGKVQEKSNSRRLNKWQKTSSRVMSSSDDDSEENNAKNKKPKKLKSKRKRDTTSSSSDGGKPDNKKKKQETDSDVAVIESEKECITVEDGSEEDEKCKKSKDSEADKKKSKKSKDSEEDAFPDQVDSEGVKEATSLLTEHIKDIIHTGELIAYRATRLLDKKVSDSDFCDPKKVDKVVNSVNLLVKLAGENLEHTVDFLSSQHKHWVKQVKKRYKQAKIKSKSSENSEKPVKKTEKTNDAETSVAEVDKGENKPSGDDVVMNGTVKNTKCDEDEKSLKKEESDIEELTIKDEEMEDIHQDTTLENDVSLICENGTEQDSDEKQESKYPKKRKKRDGDDDDDVETAKDNNNTTEFSKKEKQTKKKPKATPENETEENDSDVKVKKTKGKDKEVTPSKKMKEKEEEKDDDHDKKNSDSSFEDSNKELDESITSLSTVKLGLDGSQMDIFADSDSTFQNKNEKDIPLEDDKKQQESKDNEADSGDDAATIELLCPEDSDKDDDTVKSVSESTSRVDSETGDKKEFEKSAEKAVTANEDGPSNEDRDPLGSNESPPATECNSEITEKESGKSKENGDVNCEDKTVSDLENGEDIGRSEDDDSDIGHLCISDVNSETGSIGSKSGDSEDKEDKEKDAEKEKEKEKNDYSEDCIEARDALLGYSSDDEDDSEEKSKAKRKKKEKTKKSEDVDVKKEDDADTKVKKKRRIGPKSKTRQFRDLSSSSATGEESDGSSTTTLKRGEGTKKKKKFRLKDTEAYKRDKKLGWGSTVDVEKLSEEEFKKYYETYYSDEEDEEAKKERDNKEIKSLVNLKSLKKRRGKESEGSSDDSEKAKKKKNRKKDKKKEEEQRLIDFFNEDDSEMVPEDASGQSGSENDLDKPVKKKDIGEKENEMAMKLLLESSSCDDGDNETTEEQEDKSKKKKKKSKEKKEETVDDDKEDKADDKMDVDEEEKSEGDKGDDEEKEDGDKANKEKAEDGDEINKEEDDGDEANKEEKDGDKVNDEEEKDDKVKKKEEEDDKSEENELEEKMETEVKDEDSEEKKKEEDDESKEKEEEDDDKKDKKKKGDDDDSDASDKSEKKKKKKDWRKDKLLTEKLTDLDTSDEERLWNKKKQKEQKVEDSKKKVKRRILGSDDDDVFDVPSSSESESNKSSSDSDVFVIKKKKKKKGKKSDSDDSDGSSSDFKTKKPKRRRIKAPASDSSSNEDDDGGQKSGTPGKGRKKIHHILSDDNVAEATRRAAKEEEERRKRIADKQKLYNEIYNEVEGVQKVDKLVLDFDPETKKELVSVDSNLVAKLKPHQAQGVKFMWDACFESLKHIKKTKGTGCILAHCMGLGKTFQIVSLIHTLLNHKETQVSTVLVICPLSTVLNWCNEFNKWLKDGEVNVFELTRYKQNYERQYQLKEWMDCGGVMVLGYEMYRNLTNTQSKRFKKKAIETFQSTLVDPGPDVIVCDEGHILKNEDSAIAKALRKIKTLRRIVLTGTPLQNNLKEYHCMVQFVKPNLLGTRKEFLNRFVNPITNGQFEDSTLHDVKIMKRRAHVLHKMLEGSVQRFDYSVLMPFLPPKHEYVISIRLHEVQVKAYRHYLDFLARGIASTGGTKGAQLFADFNNLQRVWTHPRVLQMSADKDEKVAEKKRLMESDSEGSLKDFIDDDDDDDETSSNESSAAASSNEDSDVQVVGENIEKKEDKSSKPNKYTRSTRSKGPAEEVKDVEVVEKEDKEGPPLWWKQFMQADELESIHYSGKLVLLFSILRECEKIGDKVLLFSQSLFSLDLIEYFLAQIDAATQSGESKEELGNHTGSWAVGLDYFRLDGSSSSENRHIWCKSFNREDNHRARLFLISTRAGGLGINLYAANRVIIFDASWNPSHDVQSIFRVYRFGQKKPCYIYRFLAQGTMEEKIYDRQVTKLSLSCRVVDEQQIERHYNMADLQELYQFDPEQKTKRPTPILPKDRLLAELLKEQEQWIVTYHEHDSLLENKEEEELNEDERKAAWEEYENEKKGKIITNIPAAGPGLNMQALREALRNENPQATNEELEQKMNMILSQIYDYMSTQNPTAQQKYTAAQLQALQQYQIQQQQMRAQREKQMRMQQDLSLMTAAKAGTGYNPASNVSFHNYLQNQATTGNYANNMYRNPYMDKSGILKFQSKLVPIGSNPPGGSRVMNFGNDMGPNHLMGRQPVTLPQSNMYPQVSPALSNSSALEHLLKGQAAETKQKDVNKKPVPADGIETID